MLKKISNFTPKESSGSSVGSNGTKEGTGKEDSPPPLELCTKEHINKIASNLGDKWPKLIPKLGISPEEGEKFAEEGKDSIGLFNTRVF